MEIRVSWFNVVLIVMIVRSIYQMMDTDFVVVLLGCNERSAIIASKFWWEFFVDE